MLEIAASTSTTAKAHPPDVELSIPRGSCTCLMGRNGVGKTTLLKTIMAFLRLRSGKIRFDGTDIGARGPSSARGSASATFPRDAKIFSDLDVEENLMVGIEAARRPREKSLERVFAVFPALKKLLKREAAICREASSNRSRSVGRSRCHRRCSFSTSDRRNPAQRGARHRRCADAAQSRREAHLLVVEQKLAFARRIGTHYAIMDRGRAVSTGTMSDMTDDLVHRYLVV